MDDTLSIVAGLLREAERTLFITGAGLSADSGLPTYRGVGGLYERELTDEGFPIETALSGAMLEARPEIAWKYLWEIFSACRAATFNRGHEVMALVERAKPGTWVLTQNIDGFHRDAGSRNLIEIHGRASSLTCMECASTRDIDDFVPAEGEAIRLPRCPGCDSPMRPDVVLFGEMLPAAAIGQLDRTLAAGQDLVFSVGTSSLFPYITEPVRLAKRAGVPTVEINPARTDVSDLVEYRIERTGAEALDELWSLSGLG